MNDLEYTVRIKDEATKQLEMVQSNFVKTDAAIRNSLGGASTALVAMKSRTADTTQAMINFNRVVSDAPYGLIGIANNIDPMIMSFTKLKQETGSTGNAIKTMLGALTSPSGISLAISMATSLAIAFGPKLVKMFGDSSRAADEFNQKMVSLNTNLKIWQTFTRDYINTFEDFSDAELMSKAAAVEKDLQYYRKALDEVTSALKTASKEEKLKLEEMQAKFSIYVANLELGAEKIVEQFRKRKVAQEEYDAWERARRSDTDWGEMSVHKARAMNKGIDDAVDKLVMRTRGLMSIYEGNRNIAALLRLELETWEHKIKISEATYDYINSLQEQMKQSGDAINFVFEGLYAGFSVLSQEIGNGLYEAVDNAFEGANSLLEKFLASAISKIGEKVAMKGVKSLLSMIPGFGAIVDWLPFHSGGTVPRAHSGAYINAPANKEFPILVRGGETIRTEAQESALRNKQGNAPANITINFNSPVSDTAFVVGSIKKALRETGLSADRLLVNNKHSAVFA